MEILLLQLIITVPFLLAATIIGIIYLISGFRKGLWRSLFSLGATIVAVLVSVILANLIASPIAVSVVDSLPEDSLKSLGFLANLVTPLFTGIVKVLLATIIFLLAFIIFMIVLKIVANKIKAPIPNLDLDETSHKGWRFGGLAVRALDTVIVTLMLLLPIYGTIALVSPVFSVAADVSGDEDVAEIAESVDSNFCVSFYKAGPGSWVLSSLSGMGEDANDINLAEVSNNVSTLYGYYNDFTKAKTVDDRCEVALEFSKFLEKNLIEKDWFYDFLDLSTSELKSNLRKSKNAQAKTWLSVIEILDTDKEELREVLTNSIDLIQVSVEDDDFVDFLKDKKKDYDDLPDEFYENLGDILNASDEIKDSKKLLYEDKAKKMFVGYANSCDWVLIENAHSSKARTNLTKKFAVEFVDENYDQKLSSSEREEEGKAFTILLFESNWKKLKESFEENPLFGPKALREYYIY